MRSVNFQPCHGENKLILWLAHFNFYLYICMIHIQLLIIPLIPSNFSWTIPNTEKTINPLSIKYCKDCLYMKRDTGDICTVFVTILSLSIFETMSLVGSNQIGTCSFSTKHAALRCKSKDWLPRNHDNWI
jgi:hypothetical protein